MKKFFRFMAVFLAALIGILLTPLVAGRPDMPAMPAAEPYPLVQPVFLEVEAFWCDDCETDHRPAPAPVVVEHVPFCDDSCERPFLACNVPIELLQDFLAQFGDTVSIYFRNLATGFSFSHYGDRVFFGASATKAPFALYIYEKAERGETCLDSLHTFTAADYWGGSGFIRHRYSYGETFTQRELLHLMLAPSDNIATRMLRRAHGLEGYRAYMRSIGANAHFVQNITYSYLSANEAGIIMAEAYRYIQSGGRYSHEFKQNLLSNRYPFIIADYPVASKSGWAESFGGAWHDMAIVYAPSPYILVILTERYGWTEADFRDFEEISMAFQAFNSWWFGDEADYAPRTCLSM